MTNFEFRSSSKEIYSRKDSKKERAPESMRGKKLVTGADLLSLIAQVRKGK